MLCCLISQFWNMSIKFEYVASSLKARLFTSFLDWGDVIRYLDHYICTYDITAGPFGRLFKCQLSRCLRYYRIILKLLLPLFWFLSHKLAQSSRNMFCWWSPFLLTCLWVMDYRVIFDIWWLVSGLSARLWHERLVDGTGSKSIGDL